MLKNDFAINGIDEMARLQNACWILSSERRVGYNDNYKYEVETHLGRYVNRMQWFNYDSGVGLPLNY